MGPSKTIRMTKPVLYSYFRSSCSWRVRIALAYKDIDYEYRAVHLVRNGGEQHSEEFKRQDPAFIHNDETLTQSIAILEYLEEVFPERPSLLPEDPLKRAQVRQLVEVVNSGIQPLQNLATMYKHSDDKAEQFAWSKHFNEIGLQAYEELLQKTGGKYSVGDEVTLADCCLIPQVFGAEIRFKVDMSKYPNVQRICKNLEQLPAFVKALP